MPTTNSILRRKDKIIRNANRDTGGANGDNSKSGVTENYDLFKKIEGNRDLLEGHVKMLMASISMRNLLKFRPILINSGFEVIDGQHRLEAAKRLETPIYYNLQEELDHEDVIILNTNCKEWMLSDYYNMHVCKQNDNYIKFKRFIEKHTLGISTCLALFGFHRNQQALKDFKSGKFTFPTAEEIAKIEENILYIRHIIELLKKYSIHSPRQYISKPVFWAALNNFISNDQVNIDVFFKRITAKANMFRPLTTLKDYYNFFKELYNFNNKYQVE